MPSAATHPIGHTAFSWSSASASVPPVGHTMYSWGTSNAAAEIRQHPQHQASRKRPAAQRAEEELLPADAVRELETACSALDSRITALEPGPSMAPEHAPACQELQSECDTLDSRIARLEVMAGLRQDMPIGAVGELKKSIAAEVAAKVQEIAAVKKELGSKSHMAKHKLKPLVAQLLQLKAQYKEATGEEFPKRPAAAASPQLLPCPPGTPLVIDIAANLTHEDLIGDLEGHIARGAAVGLHTFVNVSTSLVCALSFASRSS